jgi:hypothetical protein
MVSNRFPPLVRIYFSNDYWQVLKTSCQGNWCCSWQIHSRNHLTRQSRNRLELYFWSS